VRRIIFSLAIFPAFSSSYLSDSLATQVPGCRFFEIATWLVFDADLAALHHFDAVFAGVVEDYSFAGLGLFGDLGVRFAHVLGGRALWAGEQMGALNVALWVVADLVELAV